MCIRKYTELRPLEPVKFKQFTKIGPPSLMIPQYASKAKFSKIFSSTPTRGEKTKCMIMMFMKIPTKIMKFVKASKYEINLHESCHCIVNKVVQGALFAQIVKFVESQILYV